MIFADKDLARKLERTEASSNAAFVEARAKLQPESGAAWIEVAGAYAMFDGVGSPLTQTFGLGVFETPTHTDLEQLEAFFIERGAEVFHEVSPLADLSLLSLLSERGYQPVELTSVLYRPLEMQNSLPINPRIKTRIVTTDEAEMWAATAAKGWSTEAPELEDFMLGIARVNANSEATLPFLAELEGKPIATGGLRINDDTALLAGASTILAGRRQGAQFALLNARLQYAAEQGCTVAMMGALPGSQSQRNAEKHNFRIAYTRIKWQLKRQN
jgi:hypothetical protein